MIEFLPSDAISSFQTKIKEVFLELDENNSVYCLYSLFLNNQTYSLIVEIVNNSPMKIYFFDGNITTFSKCDIYILAGTTEGVILLWDVRISDKFYMNSSNLNENIRNKFPNEFILRTPTFFSGQEFIWNTSNLNHKGAITKILINSENSIIKDIITLDVMNQVITWKMFELTTAEIERNFINFGSKSKIKLSPISQINFADTFSNPYKNSQPSNINNFEIDNKENLFYFCSSSQVIKSDKYGSFSISPPHYYSLKENLEQSCPLSIFITNAEMIFVGYSDGNLGFYKHLLLFYIF